VVQPDLLYISGEQKKLVEEARINGPPTLRGATLLADHPEKTMECFALRDGAYSLIASGMDEDVDQRQKYYSCSACSFNIDDRRRALKSNDCRTCPLVPQG